MKLRVRTEIVLLLAGLGALAGVAVAIAGGRFQRLWPAAAFLSFGSVAAIYAEATQRLTHRRSTKQTGLEIPRGVPMRKPIWIWIGESVWLVGNAALLAGVAAILGFAGVGMGILLTTAAIQLGMAMTDLHLEARSLTFEREGLRVHMRGLRFLVRWDVMTGVERGGSEQRRSVGVALIETDSAVLSVEPDTPRNRRRVQMAVYDGERPGGKLTFYPWTAGLDTLVLARAIRTAIDNQPARPN